MGPRQRLITRRTALGAVVAPALLTGCEPSPIGIEGGFVGAGFERGHKLRDPAVLAALRAKAPAFEQRTDVLVLGGGVAGLAAADELSRSNRSFALLELEDRVGGNARGHMMRAGDRMVRCPLGAHYLPVPPAGAVHVQQLLVSLDLARGSGESFALTSQGKRHLAHAPQERLWWPADEHNPQGRWQAGLLPQVDSQSASQQQYRRFAQALAQVMEATRFELPVFSSSSERKGQVAGVQRAFDAINFESWLREQGLRDEGLLWYLNYCCRDDYGADVSEVSAWAGLHYFASRHGFRAPGDTALAAEDRGVLAWPQGNAWLTERVAERIEAARPEALKTGHLVLSVEDVGEATRREVLVRTWHAASGQVGAWRARDVIAAMPLRQAARVMAAPPLALLAAVKAQKTSAWLVANIAISEPLIERERSAQLQLAWDSVLYHGAGLGYIHAGHQSIGASGPTVLTWYHALGTQRSAAQSLLDLPWHHWRDLIVAELGGPHPDLVRKIERIDLMRYGHAMSVPAVGVFQSASSGALHALRKAPPDARVRFAHADLAGYSVFEEAWSLGIDIARATMAKSR
jgi:hypothetical protein